jgi:GNAT superfamily N-acetyltransferase
MHKALLIDYAENQFDIFKTFNVNSYLTSYALLVHPSYRSRGIATEILKARVPFMKLLGMNVSATLFSSIGSQVAARKAGFEEKVVIGYDELQKRFPAFDFSGNESKFYKKMCLTL